ncbi:bZIP transcription factor 11-like [Vigna unguiculata]|uniref:Extracellular signal-regulated kinase 1/2 n=1 Tax=Vigna unguiculata TaxID=3917 RepID=A0A4D6MGE1_VIGUN|nr:bZIP transcription factor 11-like [Vigna unguiculata]QCD98844.1 extracellular signal-regulated kinase 1/2 [Vigna unguiculata]
MASSSGTSTMSTMLIQTSGSEEDLQLLMEQRRKKRKQSNRDSARRSRMRKQKHMDDLTAQMQSLQKENDLLLTQLNITTQHHLKLHAHNSILIAQKTELTQTLHSFNHIIKLINATNPNYHHHNNNKTNNNFVNPTMHMPFLNHPIVATADNMFLW